MLKIIIIYCFVSIVIHDLQKISSFNIVKRFLAGRPNLEQLSKKCGFNNRSSFTTAFKKFTGQKPFDYIKRKTFLEIMNNYRYKTVNNYNF